MEWLEVRFSLPAELVEPVAELLGRLAPNGIAIDQGPAIELEPDSLSPATQFPAQPPDETAGSDAMLVRAWLPKDSELEGKQRQLEQGLWHLSQIQPIPPPSFRSISGSDWSDSWRVFHKPIRVGRQLLVLPPWESAPDEARQTIVIEPGMAFGTGTHPTTRHCLEALEERTRPGSAVVDLGCGSGILSVAAARLGADRVLALDIDPEAIAATRQNARRNQVEDRLQAELGSLPELQAHAWAQGVDLLLANIVYSALESMLQGDLAGALAPGGVLVLSGLLQDQIAPIQELAEGAGLKLLEVKAEGDWRTLLYGA